MIANILLPIAADPSCEVSFEQGLDLADRLRARLILVARAAEEREDLSQELPGQEKSPVERAMPKEDFWPVEERRPGTVPDLALAAAARCEELRVAHAWLLAYGRLAPQLRDVSRLCDLAVLPRPSNPTVLTMREALRLALSAACPCLFCAASVLQPRRVVAWYDGSVASSRAFRLTCELVSLLNTSLTVVVSARARGQADELRHEARAVTAGYHIEREITALVGLRALEFAGLADEVGADMVAAPPSKPLIAPALNHSTYMTLAAG
ncbi:MAG: hypothetical protein N2512_03130 [Armatimonadetes bacterium]|nr:hypothetical protein [Armatimonadota bacterium]